jgi:hypothetical protein
MHTWFRTQLGNNNKTGSQRVAFPKREKKRGKNMQQENVLYKTNYSYTKKLHCTSLSQTEFGFFSRVLLHAYYCIYILYYVQYIFFLWFCCSFYTHGARQQC